MKLGCYTISITVDGQPLEEYAFQEDGSVGECWVASEEGKTFRVLFQQQTEWTSRSTAVRVSFDGSPTPSVIQLYRPVDIRREIKGRRTTTHLSPFMFQSITTTDEDALDIKTVSDQFGSISIALNRGEAGEAAVHDNRNASSSSSSSAYHELAVKKRRVSHVCGFGKTVAASKPITSHFNYHDHRDHPLHTFVFKYRSKSLLQAMDIIEVSAPPSPSTQPNSEAGPSHRSGSADVDDGGSSEDDTDADEEIQAIQAALLAAKARVKAARGLRSGKIVKPEPQEYKPPISRTGSFSPVPLPPRKKRPREVIVLSD